MHFTQKIEYAHTKQKPNESPNQLRGRGLDWSTGTVGGTQFSRCCNFIRAKGFILCKNDF